MRTNNTARGLPHTARDSPGLESVFSVFCLSAGLEDADSPGLCCRPGVSVSVLFVCVCLAQICPGLAERIRSVRNLQPCVMNAPMRGEGRGGGGGGGRKGGQRTSAGSFAGSWNLVTYGCSSACCAVSRLSGSKACKQDVQC